MNNNNIFRTAGKLPPEWSWERAMGGNINEEGVGEKLLMKKLRKFDDLDKSQNEYLNDKVKSYIDQKDLLSLSKEIAQIPTIHKCYIKDQRLILTEVFIDDESLSKRSRLPANEAISFFKSLIDTLISIHNKGLIHGQISPENIYFKEENGKPILANLDLVSPVLLELGKGDKTFLNIRKNALKHNDHYVAPEIIKSDQATTVRSDIFSLAIVLGFALTGELPKKKKSIMTNQMLLDWDNVTKKFPSQIDEKYIEILKKMGADKEDDRYKSAEEIKQALKSLDIDSPSIPPPLINTSGEMPPISPPSPRKYSIEAIWILFSLFLVGVFGAHRYYLKSNSGFKKGLFYYSYMFFMIVFFISLFIIEKKVFFSFSIFILMVLQVIDFFQLTRKIKSNDSLYHSSFEKFMRYREGIKIKKVLFKDNQKAGLTVKQISRKSSIKPERIREIIDHHDLGKPFEILLDGKSENIVLKPKHTLVYLLDDSKETLSLETISRKCALKIEEAKQNLDELIEKNIVVKSRNSSNQETYQTTFKPKVIRKIRDVILSNLETL